MFLRLTLRYQITVIIERLQMGRDLLRKTNSGGVVDNLNYENTDKICGPNNKTGLSFLKLSNLHLHCASQICKR